ncbi:MAG TPA: isoprenylcysteine carboxylmethyltransferase family protein [Candidatus Acidoferrum sp.]|nr:isoprenylcysteine carboxylmethyltransferase family protein [Candidatus Acidoferrum sp.]
MDISVIAFLGLLLAVGALRIFELGVSRRNQQRMIAQGATKVNEPRFGFLVFVHTAVLTGSGVEVVFLHRPFIPVLAGVMLLLFLAGNAMRFWVVRTMGKHWNVQVMNSADLGVVTSGPFRFVRHPNYAAVIVEMFSLPLIHTAWITALLGSVVHSIAISQRIAMEESVLLSNPHYRTAMGGKPRFLPGLF